MRKVFLMLILFRAAYAADDYWCLNTVFSVQGDYAYLRRTEVRDLRLVEDVSTLQPINGEEEGKKVMDTDSLASRLGFQNGIRGGFIVHGGPCMSLEALYTYVYPWEGKKTVVADGSLQFPFEDLSLVHDYVDADRAEGLYRSYLQNGEFLYWGHVTPQRIDYFSFSWTLGFRFIYLKEKMDLFFTRGDSTSPYKINTLNLLYGVQLGAMLEINPTSFWTWTFMLKGAAFLDDAKNTVLVRDNNDSTTFIDYEKRRYEDSYLFEAYGQLAYHCGSSFSVHFGYQAYILTGIALAPNQRDVSVTSHPRINVKGQIVIDGLYAGLSLGF